MLAGELPPFDQDFHPNNNTGEINNGTLCVDEIRKCAQKWSATEFNFQQSRSKFLSRYDEPLSSAGRGVLFPDDDNAMDVDLPSLLRAQPRVLESELKFHKELFSKLKWNHLELDTKRNFVEKLLKMPPELADEQTADLMDSITEEAKKGLKETKAKTQASQQEVAGLVEKVHEASRVQNVLTEADRYTQLEASLKQQRAAPLTDSEAVLLERAKLEEQRNKLAELEREIANYKTMLSSKQTVRSELEQEIEQLSAKKEEVEANAEETCKQAKMTDPKAEELGRWYQAQTAVLKQIQGIKEIRHPSTTEIQIVYQLDRNNEFCLDLVLRPQSQNAVGHDLSATCNDRRCPLPRILSTARTYFDKLDDQVSYVVSSVPAWMRLALQRDREVDELANKYDGILYDPERGELTMCCEGSGRTLVLVLGE
ncbi:hypothetical protein HK097_004635, partial [Rhizophlyctis rosea]